jgi:hypothetical protein
MFDKKPKEVTLAIGQVTEIGGYTIAYLGKLNASTCVFTCPGWTSSRIYVPIDGTFYSGTKVKILKNTNENVTLGWEG